MTNGLGWDAVARGVADEDRVTVALRNLGWSVVKLGQGAWNPEETIGGDAGVLASVRADDGPIRHTADMLATKGARRRYVDVVNCAGHRDRCLEIAKLSAADAHWPMAPTWIVDVADWGAWLIPAYRWAPLIVAGPTTYTNGGSGDPYAWFSRRADIPFSVAFQ